MTNEKLRDCIKQALEPVTESLVDHVYKVYKDIIPNIPDSIPEEQVDDYIGKLVKGQMDSLASNINLIDFDSISRQMKENKNG